jgi:hypothetical protein
MCHPVRLVGRLAWGLTVAVLLLGTLPVEAAVQLVQQSQEPEKAVSCTVGGAPSEPVARDPDILIPDGPRVAAGERAPGSDLDDPHVCPLHPEQEPGPPRPNP